MSESATSRQAAGQGLGGDKATATLARIADALGVPVAELSRPRRTADAGAILALLADPDGARLAAAYLRIADPGTRAGVADTVEKIAAILARTEPAETGA